MVLGIKGMGRILVGSILGGEAIKQVGSVLSIPSGIRTATQSFIGLGIGGTAAKPLKNVFKFR